MHWFNTGTFGWQHCSSETYIEAISHPFKKEWATNGVIQPAWSLHRLMCMFMAKRKCLLIRSGADLYDILIDKIEHKIKEGYFNKEYLEE